MRSRRPELEKDNPVAPQPYKRPRQMMTIAEGVKATYALAKENLAWAKKKLCAAELVVRQHGFTWWTTSHHCYRFKGHKGRHYCHCGKCWKQG